MSQSKIEQNIGLSGCCKMLAYNKIIFSIQNVTCKFVGQFLNVTRDNSAMQKVYYEFLLMVREKHINSKMLSACCHVKRCTHEFVSFFAAHLSKTPVLLASQYL